MEKTLQLPDAKTKKAICWEAIQRGWLEARKAGKKTLKDVLPTVHACYPFEPSEKKLDNTLNQKAWSNCVREFGEKFFMWMVR